MRIAAGKPTPPADRGRAVDSKPARNAAAGVAVWMRVDAYARPPHPRMVLDDLAWPDFCLTDFRESVLPGDAAADRYRARWYCRFTGRRRDHAAQARFLKRLNLAGFEILQHDHRADR